VRKFAKVADRVPHLDLGRGHCGIRGLRAHQAESEQQSDQSLMGAVVEISLDAATLVIAGGGDACTGRLEVSCRRAATVSRSMSSASCAEVMRSSRAACRRIPWWTKVASSTPPRVAQPEAR